VIFGLIRQVREHTDLVDAARELGYFAMFVAVIDALDDAHRAVLSDVDELDDPSLREWAAELVGVSAATADAAVAAFRSGEAMPPELVDALAKSGANRTGSGDRQ
jgi:hypothetical protein